MSATDTIRSAGYDDDLDAFGTAVENAIDRSLDRRFGDEDDTQSIMVASGANVNVKDASTRYSDVRYTGHHAKYGHAVRMPSERTQAMSGAMANRPRQWGTVRSPRHHHTVRRPAIRKVGPVARNRALARIWRLPVKYER